jgi:hypothetical protein
MRLLGNHRGAITRIEQCATISEWTANQGYDAGSTITLGPNGGILYTSGTGGNSGSMYSEKWVNAAQGGYWNITDQSINVAINVPRGTPTGADAVEGISYLNLVFKDHASVTRSYKLFAPAVGAHSHSGHSVITFCEKDYTSQGAGFNPAQIEKIFISTNKAAHDSYTSTTAQPTFELLSIWLETNLLNKGVLVFCADGGYAVTGKDSHADLAAYLVTKGCRGNFFVSRNDIGNAQKITLAQCQAMYAAGHVIGNYAYAPSSGGTYWFTNNDYGKKLAFEYNRQWLVANGMPAGARVVSTPGSGWSVDDETNLGNYIDSCGSNWHQCQSHRIVPWNGLRMPFFSFSEGNFLDLNNGTDYANTATGACAILAATKGVAMCFTHGNDDATIASFKAMADAAAARIAANNDIVVLTMLDLIAGRVPLA